MSSIRRKANGRYEADYQDRFRGIARTKRTFETRKEAEDWLDAVRRDASARLLGHKRRRLFGEALTKYLREESPRKHTHRLDLSNAVALRWPIWDSEARRWLRLEEIVLEEIPTVLRKWELDLSDVRRRCYLDRHTYHRRSDAWYRQPDPRDNERPAPRIAVSDRELVQRLDRTPGRGPFSSATLRQRQLLVKRVLNLAYTDWSTPNDRWLDAPIAAKVRLAPKPDPRDEILETYDQFLRLVIAAPVGIDAAICAAAWTGWRRANLLGLEWTRVVFPIDEIDGATGAVRRVQDGYIWVERHKTKTKKKPLTYPMTPHLEQLLRLLWDQRCPIEERGETRLYVFHRGDGRALGDFKKAWRRAKRRAGISPTLTWHGLRHTWTSMMLLNKAPSQHVVELAGWESDAMLKVYGHLQARHLGETAQLATGAPRAK